MSAEPTLADIQAETRERTQKYSQSPDPLDEESKQERTRFKSFEEFSQDEGDAGLRTITRFTYDEFMHIMEVVRDPLTRAGRGRRTRFVPEDRLLMLLTYLNSGWCMKKLALFFRLPVSTFSETLYDSARMVEGPLKAAFLPNVIDPAASKKKFAYSPLAVGACDVTLIETNRPTGFENQRPFYSHKHHCHGLKAQACVNPDGICIHLEVANSGSIHDKRMFDESSLLDAVSQHSRLPNGTLMTTHHPILFDKGYTGVNKTFPEAIVTQKKPRGRDLSAQQLAFNSRVESDRVIVENYFSRLKILWGILGQRFRGSRTELLPTIINICFALTNYYNLQHPIRAGTFDVAQAPSDAEDYTDSEYDSEDDSHLPSSTSVSETEDE